MSLSGSPHPPPLARGSIDRAAHERADPGLLRRLRDEATTRAIVVQGDRARIDGRRSLLTVPVTEVPGDVEWAFLGRDEHGTALLVAAVPAAAEAPSTGGEWVSLRVAGGALSAVDAGLFVEAVCLARWLGDAPFCPACGSRADLHAAGWSRRCAQCGREHFPRTDPAVIVAVVSPDDTRLLLGKNALWADRNMFSTFAGFVEAGESLEAAIVREVHEEAGVRTRDLVYRGSQAWPYPRSLMLGFRATATDAAEARADGEEIVEVRWFERAELAAALAGPAEFALPGATSIAHQLIVDWVEDAR
ncbi:MAG: NAD(+) diphosphatase [Microbacterium sp.]